MKDQLRMSARAMYAPFSAYDHQRFPYWKPSVAVCRSNKCAPGVDGQDFVDIEAYGLQRWLGELVVVVKGRQQPRPETTPAHGLLILKP